MKKFALTSMVAIMATSPAFAESFPSNGYMLENKTYDNAATSTNMAGVYENSVNADANYDNCPAGYWCDASGQHACSTAGDGSYTSSAAGANENTACYKACTVATANIAHATEVLGNDYYGAGVDTCAAWHCENGYHIVSINNSLTDVGYLSNSGTGINQNVSAFGLTDNGTFEIRYEDNKGTIRGRSQCSTQYGSTGDGLPSSVTQMETLPDNTGSTCWCRIDEYTPVGGSATSISGLWTYMDTYGPYSEYTCADYCAFACAVNAFAREGSVDYARRIALLSPLGTTIQTCVGNVITINWSGASQSDIDANNAGTATYGGDIRTPRAAEIVPGKVFVGWKFEVPVPVGDDGGK